MMMVVVEEEENNRVLPLLFSISCERRRVEENRQMLSTVRTAWVRLLPACNL